MKYTLKHIAASCLVLAAGMAIAMPAVAQSEVNLSRVTVTVPFAEGGGSDTLVRMLAPFLHDALPNNPTMVVQNQPGGGGIPGSNQFNQSARKTGEDLLALSSSIFVANLLRDRQIRFDLTQFIPVYVSPLGGVLYLSPSTGAEHAGDIEGIGDTRLVYGAASPTSTDALMILSMKLLGANVNPVFGTQRGAARIAFERGEFNMDHQSPGVYFDSVQPLVDEGKAVPFMTLGFLQDNGEIGRDPAVPDVPTFLEIYKDTFGEELSGPARDAWFAMFVATVGTGKALVLPPETPQPVVDTYFAAFEQVLADPQFIERSKIELGDYPQFTGTAALEQFEGASALSEDAFAWLADWYETELGVSIRR